ncbi:electron transfer flavoprotein subunit alpha/FixB family protein [soil metagenome]
MSGVLVVIEHDRGSLMDATCEALTAGRAIATATSATLEALTIGSAADGLAAGLATFGVDAVHQAHHEMLTDFGPEAWGEVVAQAIGLLSPAVVLATGTDRGNEVLAQAAARLDLPMAANCTDVVGDELTRVRWGGSLLERTKLDAPVRLLTIAHHAIEAAPAGSDGAADTDEFVPHLDPALARSVVRERVERVAGITLATAPVVVGGGRGVGSAEAFAPLEELAALLGGVVGCSRAVTNNGWRNHTDQVGQTGTRIAPTVYLACGISGAIQHWVGAMAAKHIVAVNIDPEANMVKKAGYAVIGDLHEVVPAVAAEIRRRGG